MMWWRLALLCVYLVVLVLLSRLLEAVAYLEGGALASRLLDPVALSVRRLKVLLDRRGISYAGVVEKQELTELINASGEVSEGELATSDLDQQHTPVTNFTCGTHFYEEVEDTKDSVWVVHVMKESSQGFLRTEDWQSITRKVTGFGVRVGIFDCSLDYELCERKNWRSSRLVMALPQGSRAKDNVILRSYTGSMRVQAIFDWVSFNLASRIREIYDFNELNQFWLDWNETTVSEKQKVRMVLFSHMKIPPMFFSVLSVKFTGRVKFGSVNIHSPAGQTIQRQLELKQVPSYVIMTPEGNATFGKGYGEYFNVRSLGLYLRTFHPEVNDMFLLSLVVVNAACWLQLAVSEGSAISRLVQLLLCVLKWNAALILLWLPGLALMQLTLVDSILGWGLATLRLASHSSAAALLRQDWLWYSNVHPLWLATSFILYTVLVGYLYYRYAPPAPPPPTNINNNSDWWNFNWNTATNYLFRPVATLTRPMQPTELDLEVGMELLIERLAVPNFWLRPIISTDYIKDLPVWRYSGRSVEVFSDGEGTKSDGDDSFLPSDNPVRCYSAESIRKMPYMFECEKCRALQQQREARSRSEEDLEEERRSQESACAKFLMDGDYRCLCKMNCGPGEARTGRHGSRSPAKHRARSMSPLPLCSETRREEEEAEDSGMPPGMLAATECAICLESYYAGTTLCGLPCGHSFHQHCIMGWLSRDNHCCPICRWPTYKAKPCSKHSHAE